MRARPSRTAEGGNGHKGEAGSACTIIARFTDPDRVRITSPEQGERCRPSRKGAKPPRTSSGIAGPLLFGRPSPAFRGLAASREPFLSDPPPSPLRKQPVSPLGAAFAIAWNLDLQRFRRGRQRHRRHGGGLAALGPAPCHRL